MTHALFVAAIAMLSALLITPAVRRLALRFDVVDMPDDPRRVHTEPTPRWGGIAIFVSSVIAVAVGFWVLGMAPGRDEWLQYVGLYVIGLLVLVVGALDDKLQFSASKQAAFLLACGIGVQFLGVQIAGITKPWSIAPGESPWLPLGWLAWPVTAVWMFVVTKTMDTIDGLDGLAAGIAAISAATLSAMALVGQPQQLPIVAVGAAVCGASLGFLRHNFNPARIFMGTGGAQFLGFVLAGLSVIGAFKVAAAVTVGVPVLIFGLPLFDAIFVVTRRIRHKQPIYVADKRHLHHRLLEQGLTHRQTVLVMYALALVLCATALWIFGRTHHGKQTTADVSAISDGSIRYSARCYQDGSGYPRVASLPRSGTP
jgi:UDP-GlcNAc:undecaprenyl-phosphate GlcNAc-1-phosphate transferase